VKLNAKNRILDCAPATIGMNSVQHIVFGRKINLYNRSVYQGGLLVCRGRRLGPNSPFHISSIHVHRWRQDPGSDNDHIIVLLKNTAFRQVRGTGPYGLVIKNNELIVHQRRTRVGSHLDPGILQHLELTAVRFAISFDAVLIIGDPAHIQATLFRRD